VKRVCYLFDAMKPRSSQKAIRLVLADVDGTLVTQEKKLTDRAAKAVQGLHERGILFAITSGRPPAGMKMLIEPLKIETPIAGFNGGVFTHPDLSVITSRTLAPDAAAHAVESIKAHGLTAWLYTATDWFVPDPKGPHVDREAWTVKFPPKVLADFSGHLDGAVKIVGVSDDLAAVAKCEADVQKALKGTVSAQRSQPYYLDVTNPEANKGGVAAYLAEHLKIGLDEMAALGDMPNDVPMFEKCGLSVAMGQSSPEVQAQANFVTASNENEGFAEAIEKHFLTD
jgi:Cof subfamily protein (haloacid dehalogenase superfamily)